MKVRGTLRQERFGGPPVWVLHAAEGGSFELRGPVPGHLRDQEVVVVGEPSTDFTLAMAGQLLDVRSVSPAG